MYFVKLTVKFMESLSERNHLEVMIYFIFGHAVRSVFPDQGSNLHPLLWEHGVLLLDCQGSPQLPYFNEKIYPPFLGAMHGSESK